MAQAMQDPSTQEPATPAKTGAVTVTNLPRLWTYDPALWFLEVQNKFQMHLISSQSQEFELLLEALHQHVVSEVRDVLMVPLSTTSGDDVKNTFMIRVTDPEEHRIQQLIGAEQLVNRRPTQFLRHQQKLLGDKAASLDTAILPESFRQRLFTSVRVGLATAHAQPLPQLVELAGRLLHLSASTVNATPTDVSAEEIADLHC